MPFRTSATRALSTTFRTCTDRDTHGVRFSVRREQPTKGYRALHLPTGVRRRLGGVPVTCGRVLRRLRRPDADAHSHPRRPLVAVSRPGDCYGGGHCAPSARCSLDTTPVPETALWTHSLRSRQRAGRTSLDRRRGGPPAQEQAFGRPSDLSAFSATPKRPPSDSAPMSRSILLQYCRRVLSGGRKTDRGGVPRCARSMVAAAF